jgi:tripartite-type tricarboxylate transporter receptor subunit TctC
MKRPCILAVTFLAIGLAGIAAAADNYPTRPVRLVVPFVAGGTATINARMVANQVEKQIGQSIVVDNRPGANGIIGIQIVAHAAPDGHTMLYTTTSIAINPSVYKNLPYDLFRDLAPVTIVALGEGYVLLTAPSSPMKTVKELIAQARKGKVAFGSAGVGNSTHLVAETFSKEAGIKMVHVPYKGVAPAMNAVMGGEVNVMFIPPTAVLGHIQAGRLRALGFTGKSRWSHLPDVPTISEAGVKGFYNSSGFNAWFTTAKTPMKIRVKMQTEIRKALQDPKVKDVFVKGAYQPLGNSPQEAEAFLRDQVKAFSDIVREVGIEQN